MNNYRIIDVNESNIDDFGLFCIVNKKNPGYKAKYDWIHDRFQEGLKFKILIDQNEEQLGFIEYAPGEFNWRGISAPDYFVIHCIMVPAKKNRQLGIGSLLVESCLNDAIQNKKTGVAVLSGKGTWLAKKGIFMKNDFQVVGTYPPSFELLAIKFKAGDDPSFIAQEERNFDQGLYLNYANQCPWHYKSVNDVSAFCESEGINLKVSELTEASEAQREPSPYGVFHLCLGEKILADHYISQTRFRNIVGKELA